jgi:VanZ family protein
VTVRLLAVRATRFGEGWSRGKTAVFLILTGLLWGCSDEIHQSFTPGRDVEIGDVLADTAGVALAVFLGEKTLRKMGLEKVVLEANSSQPLAGASGWGAGI